MDHIFTKNTTKKLKGLLYQKARQHLEYSDYIKLKYSNKTLFVTLTATAFSIILLYALYHVEFTFIIFLLALVCVSSLIACLLYGYYDLLNLLLFIVVTVFPLGFSLSVHYWTLVPLLKLMLSAIYLFIAPNIWAAVIQLCVSGLLCRGQATSNWGENIERIRVESLIKLYESIINSSFINLVLLLVLVFFLRHTLLHFMHKIAVLSAKVKELSQNLESLHEVKEQLDIANETREIFLQNFSHEMNNAMNGLLGAIRLAKEESKSSPIYKNLSCAEACAEVINTFSSNVIDAPKINTKEFNLCLELNSSSIFFRQTWNIIRELIRNKNLNGFLKISKRVPQMLQFDSRRLKQVFLNLAINAIKYTQKGQIYFVIEWIDHLSNKRAQSAKYEADEPVTSRNRNMIQEGGVGVLAAAPSSNFLAERIQETSNCTVIQIRTEKAPTSVHDYYFLDLSKTTWDSGETFERNPARATSGMLKFLIFDTGSGMDAEDVENLLEGYPKISSQKEKNRRIESNLGLWVSYELISKMRGSIKVKAIPDVGSVFDVQIPLMIPGDQMQGSQNYPRKAFIRGGQRTSTNAYIYSQTADPMPVFRKKKVLIVDDDFFNIEFMSSFLVKLGRECLIANDGEEALDLFVKEQKEIGLVLTDNSMPKMNGTELVKRIRKQAETTGSVCPAMYLITADAMGLPDAETQRELMIMEVITKPINFEKLSRILERY